MTLIVTAFLAEARPFIDHYKLKYQSGSPFPLYGNGQITLVISGLGKVAAGAATLYGALQSNGKVIVNVGIGGSSDWEIGSCLAAHKCGSYYPTFSFKHSFETAEFITVDMPTVNYPKGAVVEMEGAGILEIGQKVTTCELIHLFKIISDGCQSSFSKVTPKQATRLIEPHVESIASFIEKLSETVVNFRSKLFEELVQRERWTASEKIQLKELSRRYEVCGLDPQMALEKRPPKETLSWLKEQVEQTALELC